MSEEMHTSDEEREIIHSLLVAMKYHRNIIDRAHVTNSIGRTAHRMLMHVARMDGNCSQRAIAEHLEISTAAVATTLKKLEADGYILRRADPADSRFNKIVLTDSGVRLVDTTRQFFDEVDRAMFVGFSEAERAALQGFAERMAQNMRNYEHGKEDCK